MTKKSWILFILMCAVLLGGLVYISRKDKIDVDDVSSMSLQKASDKNGQIADHTIGNLEAKVVIVEYADFNCPHCSTVRPTVKKAIENHKDDVVIAFRNLAFLKNSRAAAAAAEAAGLQGKFWQMHDKLFENQPRWGSIDSAEQRTELFKTYAKEIGIDTSKFEKDLSSPKVKAKIDFDKALGSKALDGKLSTPSLFINGKKIDNANLSSAEKFEKEVLIPAIEQAK